MGGGESYFKNDELCQKELSMIKKKVFKKLDDYYQGKDKEYIQGKLDTFYTIEYQKSPNDISLITKKHKIESQITEAQCGHPLPSPNPPSNSLLQDPDFFECYSKHNNQTQ